VWPGGERFPGGWMMFDQIVAGTNGSSRSRQVASVAAGLAAAHGATLHLVWAYRTAAGMASAVAAADVMGTAMGADGDMVEEVDAELRRLRSELVRTGITVETYACPGGAADALLEVAAHQSADLIVVGNKGMHGARRVLGSIPNTIAHQAGCAVLIVPTEP
jgi:nucleotide-binding universal stress UspA family protein